MKKALLFFAGMILLSSFGLKAQSSFSELEPIESLKLKKLDKVCETCSLPSTDDQGRVILNAEISSTVQGCDKKIIITGYSFPESGEPLVSFVAVLYKLQGEYWFYDKAFNSDVKPKIKQLLAASRAPLNVSPF